MGCSLRNVAVASLVGVSVATAQQPPDSAKKAAGSEKSKPAFNLEKLKWMAGCWQAPLDKDTFVEEIWTTPNQNLLLATTRVIKKGKAEEYEFTRITVHDSVVVFAASSDGKPFDEYPMKQLVDEYVVFENLNKPFPQRIIYRLSSDEALIPRNEGDGRPSFEVRMKKVKCPGA